MQDRPSRHLEDLSKFRQKVSEFLQAQPRRRAVPQFRRGPSSPRQEAARQLSLCMSGGLTALDCKLTAIASKRGCDLLASF
jgi:hypothetical protein